MSDYRKIIAVDFDGVIHQYTSPWTDAKTIADGVVPGFFEWLDVASQMFDVVIFSSRCGTEEAEEAMGLWLVTERAKWRKAGGKSPLPDLTPISFRFTREKPAAFITIDDRAMTFNGKWDDPQWAPARLAQFKPWNKP